MYVCNHGGGEKNRLFCSCLTTQHPALVGGRQCPLLLFSTWQKHEEKWEEDRTWRASIPPWPRPTADSRGMQYHHTAAGAEEKKKKTTKTQTRRKTWEH